jgi:hypothetical protein
MKRTIFWDVMQRNLESEVSEENIASTFNVED